MTAKLIRVGAVAMGGRAPISIQSMTNTDTRDVQATIAQILRLEQAGCEIIRISVFDGECVRAIPAIRSAVNIPLVADIHFDYRLAIGSMENGVDKIRFNPGNIGGRENIRRLVSCAKAHGVPIRIGVNSGSVEKDVLEKFGGPTPEAMVESAMKHVRILEKEGFEDIVLSIKASNAPDTVAAYRLISRCAQYPLHIGVTEAGPGETAVIKSAVGLGALLLDGIGDTIRVSITGDPVKEVWAAKSILQAAGARRTGIEIISCPTCGRTRVDLEKMVMEIEAALPNTDVPLKIAVMGCAVNGPGEVREADMGIAFGDGMGVVFIKGEPAYSAEAEELTPRFIQDVEKLISQRQGEKY